MSAPERAVGSAHGLGAVWVVDRRTVLGTLAAVSAVTLLPLPAGAVASPQPSASAAPLLADWHIDDQWGPRYAEPIAFARAQPDGGIAEPLLAV
jgi:hypothetical protein